MEVVKFADPPVDTAPGHEEVLARRLQDGEASSAAFPWSGFPAGSVVPMDTGTFGKIYIVAEGALVIEQGDGVRHALGVGDSIYAATGETRAVLNKAAKLQLCSS